MTVTNAKQLLAKALKQGPVCVVQVLQVQGSAPRGTGTWMGVGAWVRPGSLQGLIGTIGGGHLEYQAMERALRVLNGDEDEGTQRYALGPSLGQCCGGVVHLCFQVVRSLHQFENLGLHLPAPMPVAVFGAGHVGSSLVRILEQLPCSITWIDSRTDIWPEHLAGEAQRDGRLQRIQLESVQDAVQDLPSDCRVVILTHSHVEDWDVVAACLARRRRDQSLPFVGLIGSDSKWVSFRRRLLARGFDAAEVDAVECPVGVEGIEGKEPAVIAVAIAARLLQTRSSVR